MKYVCELCGLIYDEEAGLPARGIAPGTKFQELPEDFDCPGCGYGLESFSKVEPRRPAAEAAQPDYSFWHGAKYQDGNNESER